MKNSAADFIIALAAPLVYAQTFDAASLKPGGDAFVMRVTSKMKGKYCDLLRSGAREADGPARS